MDQQLIELNNLHSNLNLLFDRHKNNIELLNWKKIDGYNYSVSRIGQVRNDKTKVMLNAYKDSMGYLRVDLSRDGKRKTLKVHRLVAITFIDNHYNKVFVDHINGERSDNRISNLRWATFGENNYNSKLSRNSTSLVKGVNYCKRYKKWIARIRFNNKRICIGSYDTLEEAKEARQNKAKELYKEFINDCEL